MTLNVAYGGGTSYADVRSPMLEPDMGKPLSPVLRGGGAGNSTSLPDRKE